MAKGWLDNYGKQENYNDSKTSVPEGYEGEGYSMKGRNYSPAWGGQFQMGGSIYPVNYVPQAQMGASIPGTPGFTYARTNDPAPDNGPGAKKTLPSAQNGVQTWKKQQELVRKEKTEKLKKLLENPPFLFNGISFIFTLSGLYIELKL